MQGRKFLTDHRMLVTHTLKRSAGIGTAAADDVLSAKVEDLADGLMVIISATGFLEVCLPNNTATTITMITDQIFFFLV